MTNRFSPISAAVRAPLQIAADLLTPRGAVARSYEDLTPPRLERLLGLPAGSVTGSRVREVDHGTSLRVRLEVLHDDTSTSVFIKHTPTHLGTRLFNIATRLCQHEVHFYRHWADETFCAPMALAAHWHPGTARSTLVLPDLNAEGFAFIDVAGRCTGDQAALAVEALAGMHRTFWKSARFDHAGEYLPANSVSNVGTPLLCRYLGGNPDSLAEHLPPALAAELGVLRTHARAMNPLFNSFDQTLLHNDTHLGNMAFGHERAMLIDWQVCIIGSAVKDFAYFMSSMDSDVRRAHERELLVHYLDVLSAGDGPVVSWDDAWRAYRILAVTGFIAAAATALFGDRLQSADNARAGLQRTVSTLIDLESLGAVREQVNA